MVTLRLHYPRIAANAGANSITLGAANDFGGAATFKGTTIVANDINALNATLTATGASTLSAGGDLTLSGTSAGLTTTTTGTGKRPLRRGFGRNSGHK